MRNQPDPTFHPKRCAGAVAAALALIAQGALAQDGATPAGGAGPAATRR
ncbi:hypothetical protein [Herbaspirillum sp. SJZ107]|nr:hypothetical protein [Herbaspirillum sp. SJZ107]